MEQYSPFTRNTFHSINYMILCPYSKSRVLSSEEPSCETSDQNRIQTISSEDYTHQSVIQNKQKFKRIYFLVNALIFLDQNKGL